MTVTMTHGVIYLILKANKDILSIDNWRPITLLTVDYKVLACAIIEYGGKFIYF